MAEQLSHSAYLELIAQAQAGDEEAFARLYEVCYEPVLRYIAIRVPAADDAEDLAQQVFIRFYKNLHNWQDQGFSPLAYIFTIARSVVADYWRSQKNRPIDNSEEVLPLLVDSAARPDELAHSADTRAAILRGINQLPENYQEVIALRLIEGLTSPEIAKMIGKSEVATRQLYSRGLSKLRDILSKELRNEIE